MVFIGESSKRRVNAYIDRISKFNKYIHFHSLPHYFCVFLWIPESVTLRDFLSKCSQRFIDLIDAITSKVVAKNISIARILQSIPEFHEIRCLNIIIAIFSLRKNINQSMQIKSKHANQIQVTDWLKISLLKCLVTTITWRFLLILCHNSP